MSSMRYCSRNVSSDQQAGMNAHISKPIEIPTLLKTLEDVLEVTLKNQELLHTPYPVSKETIHQAILNLEDYSPGA